MTKLEKQQNDIDEVLAALGARQAEATERELAGPPTPEALPDEIGALNAEISSLQAERDELKDKLLRAYAESENMRKRAERDRREAEQYGGSRLARDMIPVYDNLMRALQTVTEEQSAAAKSVIDGVELTRRELTRVFAKHDIKVIKPEIGERLDPNLHEAMFEAPMPGTEAGQIIQLMSEGFKIHDRLLRPAQVGVSSTPAAQSADNSLSS